MNQITSVLSTFLVWKSWLISVIKSNESCHTTSANFLKLDKKICPVFIVSKKGMYLSKIRTFFLKMP